MYTLILSHNHSEGYKNDICRGISDQSLLFHHKYTNRLAMLCIVLWTDVKGGEFMASASKVYLFCHKHIGVSPLMPAFSSIDSIFLTSVVDLYRPLTM